MPRVSVLVCEMHYTKHAVQYTLYSVHSTSTTFQYSASLIPLFSFSCAIWRNPLVLFFLFVFAVKLLQGFFYKSFQCLHSWRVCCVRSFSHSLAHICLFIFFAPFRVYLFRMGVDIVRILMLSSLTFFTKCVVHILF